jgi:hypothetical protein
MSHDPIRYNVKAATGAILSALPGPFNTGDVGVVATFGGATFSFVEGSALGLVSGVVLTGVGGQWLRVNGPDASISAALTLYVSTTLGDDAYDGLAAVAGANNAGPLATFAEFVRRYGSSPILSAVLNITFLDAAVAEDIDFEPVFLTGGQVLWNGTLSAPIAAGNFTVDQAYSLAANTPLEITPGVDLDAQVGAALIVNTTVGGSAWIAKIVTAATRYRLSPFIALNTTTNAVTSPVPVTGNAFTVNTATSFTGKVRLKAKGAIGVAPSFFNVLNCFFNSGAGINVFSSETQTMNFVNMRHTSSVASGYFSGRVNHINSCWPVGAATPQFISQNGGQISIKSGLSLVPLLFSRAANVILQTGLLIQGTATSILLNQGGVSVYAQGVMAMDYTTSFAKITGGAALDVNLSPGGVAGSTASASAFVFDVQCGVVNNNSGGTWQNAVGPRVVAPATSDFKLNGQLGGSPYVPGSGVTVAEVGYTFANIDAAAAAGTGFGGSASRQDAFASLTKST